MKIFALLSFLTIVLRIRFSISLTKFSVETFE